MLRSIGILLVTLLLASTGATATSGRTLLVYGDSLSAAYGLRADQGWVALLQKRLDEQGYGYRVVNASVSGETTSGGRARLQRALEQHRPEIVVLELGANDGLRGLPMASTRSGLEMMLDVVRASGAKVLLIGIQLPPNYGPQYTRAFATMFADLAKARELSLVPFLLDGIALDATLMQEDGLHPNAAGQPRALDNVWPHLQKLLRH
jgi:acyl-CoA thioesterase-1